MIFVTVFFVTLLSQLSQPVNFVTVYTPPPFREGVFCHRPCPVTNISNRFCHNTTFPTFPIDTPHNMV